MCNNSVDGSEKPNNRLECINCLLIMGLNYLSLNCLAGFLKHQPFFSPPSHLPRPKKSSGSVRSQGYSSAFSSLPRLLQTPQAQRLERDVADFTLAPQVTWKFDLQGDFVGKER